MVLLLRRRNLGRTSCREIAKNTRNNVVAVRSDLLHRHNVDDHDVLIRWGCTSQVPIKTVVNKSEAIHEVNDKLKFRRKLNEVGLCPRTWFDDWQANQQGQYPLIVRPSKHAQGRRLHVCNNVRELMAACARYPQYYISDLINKVAEYRVFVVQGRVACVAKKTPGNPEDVAWNVARGGYFENVRWDEWPLKAVKLSLEAFNLSSLDFGGVDVMVDKDDKAYILEINSAPSLTSPYRQECMAKCIDWLLENGTDRIPLVEKRGGYLKFIHPAITDRAQLVEKA